MFLVKISYHHQRRLAIHYHTCVLLNNSWVASTVEKSTPVCLKLPSEDGQSVLAESHSLFIYFFHLNLLAPVCKPSFWYDLCTEQFFLAV